MKQIFVNKHFSIILFLILPMFSMCSKPYIDSYNENVEEINLIIFYKSKECGFITIYKERKHITFQFSYGWTHIGKGSSSLNNFYFKYEKGELILFQKNTKKKIFNIKCDQRIYDDIKSFLNEMG
jgi:hypothetical protein